MAAQFRLLGETYDIVPRKRGEPLVLSINGESVTVRSDAAAGALQTVSIDGRSVTACVATDGDDVYLHLDGEVWHVEAINPIDAAGGGGGGTASVVAPMPGIVVSIAVTRGDTVNIGQTLIVIESMKLQTAITAERDGTIGEIFVNLDETFDKGAELMRFDIPDETV